MKNFKQTLVTIILLLLTMWAGLFAQNVGDTFIKDGINYKITSLAPNNNVAVINKDDCYSSTVNIPTRVANSGTTYNVTSIGNGAFWGCSSLTSITIPSSVTSIGESAFSLSGLTSITIPNSVTSIGKSAFSNLGLTSITIPSSVTSIGDGAFENCVKLTAIDVNAGNTAYSSADGVLFNKDKTILIQCPLGKAEEYTIPSSVTSIGNSAFAGCSSLTDISISEGVTDIGNRAFAVCSSLTSITIPNSVTSIGEAAFLLSGLTSITIPNSVTSIGEFAFSLSGLTSITIPNSVTSIGEGAFSYCPSLAIVISLRTDDIGGVTIDDDVLFGSDNAKLYVPAGKKTAYQGSSWFNMVYNDADRIIE